MEEDHEIIANIARMLNFNKFLITNLYMIELNFV